MRAYYSWNSSVGRYFKAQTTAREHVQCIFSERLFHAAGPVTANDQATEAVPLERAPFW